MWRTWACVCEYVYVSCILVCVCIYMCMCARTRTIVIRTSLVTMTTILFSSSYYIRRPVCSSQSPTSDNVNAHAQLLIHPINDYDAAAAWECSGGINTIILLLHYSLSEYRTIQIPFKYIVFITRNKENIA